MVQSSYMRIVNLLRGALASGSPEGPARRAVVLWCGDIVPKLGFGVEIFDGLSAYKWKVIGGVLGGLRSGSLLITRWI